MQGVLQILLMPCISLFGLLLREKAFGCALGTQVGGSSNMITPPTGPSVCGALVRTMTLLMWPWPVKMVTPLTGRAGPSHKGRSLWLEPLWEGRQLRDPESPRAPNPPPPPPTSRPPHRFIRFILRFAKIHFKSKICNSHKYIFNILSSLLPSICWTKDQSFFLQPNKTRFAGFSKLNLLENEQKLTFQN